MLAHLKALLTETEAREVIRDLRSAPFEDGKATATGAARQQKNSLQLNQEHPKSKKWARFVEEKLRASEAFSQIAWPRHMQPLRFCRYDPGMSYGPHVDMPFMDEPGGLKMRTDLSMTLFLSAPSEYEGGQLVLHGDGGTKKIRGEPGDAVVYPSGLVHQVEPVTRGRRVVAISWIESRVREAADRRLLYDMGRSLAALDRRLHSDPDAAADLLRLRNCFFEMTRRFLS